MATDAQLEFIFNNESDLPNHLLVGLVTEMMERKLFDGMIRYMAKQLLGTFDYDEIIQTAHIGIYQLALNFKRDKIDFKKLTYIVIERRLKDLIKHKYTKRFRMNQSALQNEMPVMIESTNVEKTVIQKCTLQEQLEKLTEKERYIINQFIEGYSLNYLADHVFKKDSKYVHYHFKKALKKMGITDYHIGARSGLKGA